MSLDPFSFMLGIAVGAVALLVLLVLTVMLPVAAHIMRRRQGPRPQPR